MGEVEEVVNDIVDGGDDDDGKKDPRVERLNTIISAAVALVATFLAISNVKDGNICQAMQKAQANANDQWAYYQAKSTKGHIAEGVLAELELMRGNATEADQPKFDAQIASWKEKLAGYETQKAEIKKSAEDFGAEYDRLNNRDDQFDMSEALLSLSIALFGVTALTKKQWLLYVAGAFALFGLVLGLAGFAGWSLHPDFLARWLS